MLTTAFMIVAGNGGKPSASEKTSPLSANTAGIQTSIAAFVGGNSDPPSHDENHTVVAGRRGRVDEGAEILWLWKNNNRMSGAEAYVLCQILTGKVLLRLIGRNLIVARACCSGGCYNANGGSHQRRWWWCGS